MKDYYQRSMKALQLAGMRNVPRNVTPGQFESLSIFMAKPQTGFLSRN